MRSEFSHTRVRPGIVFGVMILTGFTTCALLAIGYGTALVAQLSRHWTLEAQATLWALGFFVLRLESFVHFARRVWDAVQRGGWNDDILD